MLSEEMKNIIAGGAKPDMIVQNGPINPDIMLDTIEANPPVGTGISDQSLPTEEHSTEVHHVHGFKVLLTVAEKILLDALFAAVEKAQGGHLISEIPLTSDGMRHPYWEAKDKLDNFLATKKR